MGNKKERREEGVGEGRRERCGWRRWRSGGGKGRRRRDGQGHAGGRKGGVEEERDVEFEREGEWPNMPLT